ncbi:PepSY-associated TM helix domain-containing protein [Pelagibius sp.]|uniref:PepSY-associated TM helix domain-containing protein n=1 Tax=Pelagibius sp. TaxID=1931238 RepID=UPI003BB17B4A
MALSQRRTKRLVAIHGWSGAILGLLLYVVLLTGAVAVFAFEIGSWSASGMKAQEPFTRPIDGTLRTLAAQVPGDYHEDISVFHNSAGHVVAFLHTHAQNDEDEIDEKGILFELHPVTHEVLTRREGFSSEVFGADPWGALDEFLVELHVNLHLPDPWGLYATGVLGLLMLASAISGILMHRHVIKDLFLAPRLSSRLLTARDRHNLVGSWALPFAFVLAFTGAFLSFAIALGLPTISTVAFGGDRMAFFERLVGLREAEDPTPAPTADLDAMLAAAAEAAGSVPRGFSVHHWGRADATVTVFHLPAEGDLIAEQQVFEGATGVHLGSKPALGTKPSLGSAVFGLIPPLHFGTFAGLLSRTVWFALGLVGCYVTLTGLQLWLQRRAEDLLWRRLARAVPVFGYGLPIAMAGSGIGFFLSLPAASTLFWTPAGFLIGCALAVVAGLAVRDSRALARLYGLVLGTSLIALPLLRMAMGGAGWVSLLSDGNAAIVVFDLVLLLAGVGIVLGATGLRLRPVKRPQSANRVAAE